MFPKFLLNPAFLYSILRDADTRNEIQKVFMAKGNKIIFHNFYKEPRIGITQWEEGYGYKSGFIGWLITYSSKNRSRSLFLEFYIAPEFKTMCLTRECFYEIGGVDLVTQHKEKKFCEGDTERWVNFLAHQIEKLDIRRQKELAYKLDELWSKHWSNTQELMSQLE